MTATRNQLPKNDGDLQVQSSHRDDVTGSNEKIVHLRPNGRPSKYLDKYAEMILHFFDIELYREIRTEVIDSAGTITKISQSVLNTFPTFARFAFQIKVSRDTLLDWSKAKNTDGTLRHPEFSGAYARARDLQESLLIEGGMSGAYEPGFACLMAQRLLGWSNNPKSRPDASVERARAEKLDQVYKDAMKVAMDKAAALALNKKKQKEQNARTAEH